VARDAMLFEERPHIAPEIRCGDCTRGQRGESQSAEQGRSQRCGELIWGELHEWAGGSLEYRGMNSRYLTTATLPSRKVSSHRRVRVSGEREQGKQEQPQSLDGRRGVLGSV